MAQLCKATPRDDTAITDFPALSSGFQYFRADADGIAHEDSGKNTKDWLKVGLGTAGRTEYYLWITPEEADLLGERLMHYAREIAS